MYAALRLELPAVPGPDQRDRNDLLIVLDMFQVLERRVERGHIEVRVIADVAKPVVPVLPRLADEVVFIALAEQTVGFRMLLRIIYDALDLNSHFKLFQLVSRRGFGLHRRPLRNIGHSLRDRFRNFGLPACEGVAGAGRGAVERGGRGILPKVRIDLIGENFFVLNAVGVGDGVFLRHMYAALRLELPAVPGPDQRDRNDLLIVLDMFQVLERRVERGHIEVRVIADVAKPVVPVLPRLADEVVFIALAEQTVGFRMLLRIIYDALDLNSHFKLFQLVSRRGFGLHRRPLRNIGHSLRDRFCNFGLPACEGVAFTVRSAAHERGGRVACIEAGVDVVLEDYLVFNAVGVGDGEGVGDSFADRVENNTVQADLVIVHSPFLRFFVPEQRHGLGLVGCGMRAVLIG